MPRKAQLRLYWILPFLILGCRSTLNLPSSPNPPSTPTVTPLVTVTNSQTPTFTGTPTPGIDPTITPTGTFSWTPTNTPTTDPGTSTATATSTSTIAMPTATPTPTFTGTPIGTPTDTPTAASGTYTATSTPTGCAIVDVYLSLPFTSASAGTTAAVNIAWGHYDQMSYCGLQSYSVTSLGFAVSTTGNLAGQITQVLLMEGTTLIASGSLSAGTVTFSGSPLATAPGNPATLTLGYVLSPAASGTVDTVINGMQGTGSAGFSAVLNGGTGISQPDSGTLMVIAANTPTQTATGTPTKTPTKTPTSTWVPSRTPTWTPTGTLTPSATFTTSPTWTPTGSFTPTFTPTPTGTWFTPTPTPT